MRQPVTPSLDRFYQIAVDDLSDAGNISIECRFRRMSMVKMDYTADINQAVADNVTVIFCKVG